MTERSVSKYSLADDDDMTDHDHPLTVAFRAANAPCQQSDHVFTLKLKLGVKQLDWTSRAVCLCFATTWINDPMEVFTVQ